MELEQLQKQYKQDLFDDCIPFLDKYVVDRVYGGFLCNTDRDGSHLSERKETWFEGRGIWVYSFLYRNFGGSKEHLELARKTMEFILGARPEGADTLWPDRLTREGKPLSPPSESIYGDMFIAEGLAEFAWASGDMRPWEEAKRLIQKCLRVYDRPGYAPDVVASYRCPKPVRFPGARSQGVAMVLIRVIKQMLEHRADPELQRVVDDAVDAVLSRFYNPDYGLNNELLNHDFTRPTGDLARFIYTGHAIETLWMLADEAVRRGDRQMLETAAARFRRHVEVAWDDVYGGVFRGSSDIEQNQWVLDKVLWEQEEVLIGALLFWEHLRAPWARDIFEKTYDYVQEHYPLRKYGFGYWITSADRKVTFEKHFDRIENYHHPRHLMLNLLAIKRLIAKGEKSL
ncbi:MAG: AGE family epimerase/isomerase [Acidobacteriales bacterium]|nr:AGE family epimerase/isomerase [Terriglobales bacterium]